MSGVDEYDSLMLGQCIVRRATIGSAFVVFRVVDPL